MLKAVKRNFQNVVLSALENLQGFRNVKCVDLGIGNVYKLWKEVHTKSTWVKMASSFQCAYGNIL